MIDKRVKRASFASLSFHLSVCPSVPPFMLYIYRNSQYNQRHSPDASLPGQACFFLLLFSPGTRSPHCGVCAHGAPTEASIPGLKGLNDRKSMNILKIFEKIFQTRRCCWCLHVALFFRNGIGSEKVPICDSTSR